MARPLAVKVKRGLTDGMAAQKRGPPNEVLIDACGTSRGVWGNGSWFRVHGSGLDGKAAPIRNRGKIRGRSSGAKIQETRGDKGRQGETRLTKNGDDRSLMFLIYCTATTCLHIRLAEIAATSALSSSSATGSAFNAASAFQLSGDRRTTRSANEIRGYKW